MRFVTLGGKGKHVFQMGTFMKSDYTKRIPVHHFKVDAKHPFRVLVKQRVCIFGIEGSRPNGFILAQ